MHGCKTIQAHTDPHPTKSEWDSANAKQAHTDVGVTKGERDDAKQGIVRFWKGWCGGAGRGLGVLLRRLREGCGGKTAVRTNFPLPEILKRACKL